MITTVSAPAHANISPWISRAWDDYVETFRRRALWMSLAWTDVRVTYKRSVLGPFWITLSTAIAIATIGPIYARLFGTKLDDYFAFLATSIILWNFIAGTINSTDVALIGAEGMLKDMKMPFTLFVVKEIYKNLILLAHTSVIIVVLYFFFTFHINLFLFLLSLVTVLLNLFWIGLFLAVFCARYRDIAQIITSLVQVAFFLTPIMWQPGMLGDRHIIVAFNPFYYLIDIFRSPILSGNINTRNLTICIAAAVIGNIFTFFFYAAKRRRIAYWL
jgi:ABC-type polysaccharide/polyol phosphate export permease